MRQLFVLAWPLMTLAACGGGGNGAGFQPAASISVDLPVARVNVDNVTARATFNPGPEALGQGSSIIWTLAAKPPGSSATLQPPFASPQDPAAVTFAPDVSGTYTLQASVAYGTGFGSANATANVTAVHAMFFSVLTDAGSFPSGPPFGPPSEFRFWAKVTSDAQIASAEAFLDGQSLGVLTAPNATEVCQGQHGIPCPSYPAYDYSIPYPQLAGTHSLRWVITGVPGSGIRGEGTVQIGQNGISFPGIASNLFGVFSGNP